MKAGDRAPGMSLVELVVALLLLSMALVALAGAGLVAQRSLASASAAERITFDAAHVLDSLARQRRPLPGWREADGVLLRWNVEEDSGTSTVRLTGEAYDGAVRVRLDFEARHATQ